MIKTRIRKPSEKTIKTEINKLRKFIDANGDQLETRLAQVAEEVLRWSIEETDWIGPMASVKVMAGIIRDESGGDTDDLAYQRHTAIDTEDSADESETRCT